MKPRKKPPEYVWRTITTRQWNGDISVRRVLERKKK